jgi:potassium inwardly-rectifying channel subfamily J
MEIGYMRRSEEEEPFVSSHRLHNAAGSMASEEGLIEDLDSLHDTRLLDRSAPFHQSHGRFNIVRKNVSRSLYWLDPFHSVLHWTTWKSIMLVALTFLSGIFTFAAIYYSLSDTCGLKMETFLDASFFSLTTFTTIGYGAPTADLYFNECVDMFWTICLQSFCSCLFDALCLCLVYTRLSRSSNRTSTIVFSNKAIVREIEGRLYFSLQIAEMRKHQLVEAHVRCYAIKHDVNRAGDGTDPCVDPPIFFQTCNMRLNHPDDEVSGSLFLALPATVVHHIDTSSPLVPYELRSRRSRWPRMAKRVDQFDDDENECTQDELQHAESIGHFRNKVREYMNSARIEIIVLVEGIDFLTSDTLQARHSYILDEIEWDATFMPCVSQDPTTCTATIDFGKFHQLVDASPIVGKRAEKYADLRARGQSHL